MKSPEAFLRRIELTLISLVFIGSLITPVFLGSKVNADATNLIANPQLTTQSSPNSPADWQVGNWGTNTISSSYLDNGPAGDTNSVSINMTSYTSGDAKWYFNPVNVVAGDQYSFSDEYESSTPTEVVVAYTMTDGTNQYDQIGSPAASASWQTFSANFVAPSGVATATVYHLINSVGSLTTSDFSLTGSSVAEVSITSPNASTATSTPLSGSVTLAASASDSAGVASVQFQIDGSNVGSPITASPYDYGWNSASVTNGTHVISAIVTGGDGAQATSAPVTVEVSNTAPAGGNLIPNPLLETPSSTTPGTPQDWTIQSWGTNSFNSSYLASGSTGDTNSVSINMTSYTSGDAKWIFTPQNVAQDTQYYFSDYYQSNVQTMVDAVFTMSNGSTEYQIIGYPYPSSSWSQFNSKFSVPLGAVNVTIYHLIQSVGSLTIDDASLVPYTPVGFNSPLLTLTFDDGYESAYTKVMPALKNYNMTSTQFIITDLIGSSGYMTKAQIKTLYKNGNEIASHTITHDDLTQETPAEVSNEMTKSQAILQTDIGAPVTDLAYPYGLYNAEVVSAAQSVYTAARGVETGLNSKDNFNPYDLKVEDMYNTTTTAQVRDWVKQAIDTKTWLILVYHDNYANAPSSDIYNVTPTKLNAQLAAIKTSGITVENLNKALSTVEAQL